MSLVLYHSDEQKQKAEQSREQEQVKRNPEVITTEIRKADIFYPAEE